MGRHIVHGSSIIVAEYIVDRPSVSCVLSVRPSDTNSPSLDPVTMMYRVTQRSQWVRIILPIAKDKV